jgi:hypothetical protein
VLAVVVLEVALHLGAWCTKGAWRGRVQAISGLDESSHRDGFCPLAHCRPLLPALTAAPCCRCPAVRSGCEALPEALPTSPPCRRLPAKQHRNGGSSNLAIEGERAVASMRARWSTCACCVLVCPLCEWRNPGSGRFVIAVHAHMVAVRGTVAIRRL